MLGPEQAWKVAAAILVFSGAALGVLAPVTPTWVLASASLAAAAGAAGVYRARWVDRMFVVGPFLAIVVGAWVAVRWYLAEKLRAPMAVVWNVELLMVAAGGAAPGWLLHELIRRLRHGRSAADEVLRCSECSAVIEPHQARCLECGASR